MSDLLTSRDVEDLRFTVRHMQGGYDMDEVDQALRDIMTTLSAHENDLIAAARRAGIIVHVPSKQVSKTSVLAARKQRRRGAWRR